MNSEAFQKHKTVWIALSEFYLDTELTPGQLNRIAKTLKSTGFSLAEIESINKDMVFPVLLKNLSSPLGIWTGFQEEWLIDSIKEYANSAGWLSKYWYRFQYLFYSKYFKDDWLSICHQWNSL